MSCLVTALIGGSMPASAITDTYFYTFYLDGAGANPPNNSTGTAFGTLKLTDPPIPALDQITLSMTYSGLSSAMTQVNGNFGNFYGSVNVDFIAGDLPPSGNWTSTQVLPLDYVTDIIQYISLGEGNLQLGTGNYPYGGFGEIGGGVTAPEPSSLALLLFAAFLGSVWRISQKIKKAAGILTPGWRRQPSAQMLLGIRPKFRHRPSAVTVAALEAPLIKQFRRNFRQKTRWLLHHVPAAARNHACERMAEI
jgi:hypothetical protein